MFDVITDTWNPVVGCLHHCTYCWARRLAETKLKNIERYRDGFKPKLVEKELNRKFHKKYVFAVDMGDLFGDWVPSEWILKVIEAIKNSPSSYFLFLTKNPKRYMEFLNVYPENVVLGATIETNRNYPVSKVPSTTERYNFMKELSFKNKIVSIEPIMDFDLETFAEWVRNINPVMVHVGYDNYNNKLPEPTLFKTKQLIGTLGSFTRVKTLTLRESSQ
jgi:protein gp37